MKLNFFNTTGLLRIKTPGNTYGLGRQSGQNIVDLSGAVACSFGV